LKEVEGQLLLDIVSIHADAAAVGMVVVFTAQFPYYCVLLKPNSGEMGLPAMVVNVTIRTNVIEYTFSSDVRSFFTLWITCTNSS
jgi:hypothetical protein